MKRFLGGAMILAALVAFALGLPAGASAQPPETETIHETFADVEVDTICGEVVFIDTSGKMVFHITQFEDGRYHVTGTGVGQFSFELASGETVSGRFTFWFGENLTGPDNFNATFTFNATGKGDEGTHVMQKEVAHVTFVDGELIVEFDNLTNSCK
jgi:hypothetical protein